MLKALELVGFKSFADRTRFEFPPGITCIVGPNGSGKSNVVDAIKWVLGEQSVKSLRGKEMADCIFNGSATRQPVGAAEATLVFDNPNNRLGIDAPEVAVTRRVYRNGEGEYLINKQPCRLRDIRDLFAGTGAATQAYSVIEQGKVDVLLQSSPKERRSVFEEAAGISRFKARKIESLRRLERVDQNLLRLHDIVEEVENRLKSVRNQASKARRYQEHVERLQQLRTQVAQSDWRRLSEKLLEEEAALAAKNQTRDELSRRLDVSEARLLELDVQLGEAAAQLRTAEAEDAEYRRRLAAADGEIRHHRDRLRELEDEIGRHRKHLTALNSRAGDQQSQVAATSAALGAAEDRFKELTAVLAGFDLRKAEAEAERREWEAAGEEARRRAREYERTAGALESDLSVTTSRLADVEQIQSGRARRRDELAGRAEQVASAQAEQAARLAELERRHAAAAAESAAAREEVARLRREVEAVAAKVGDSKRRMAVLIERRSLLSDLERRGEGLQAGVKQMLAMRETKESGPPTDSLGLAADLIRSPLEVAPAVDTALADHAQFFVMPTGYDPETISQFAATKLAGRVGFLIMEPASSGASKRNAPVDAVLAEAPASGSPAGRPGVLGRLDLLVDVDLAHRNLVRRLLGRAWLVDDMRQALSLREEFPMLDFVTRTGELISAHGELVVGRRAAGVGLVSRRSELQTLETDIAALDREIAASAEEGRVVELRRADQEAAVGRLEGLEREAFARAADERSRAKALAEQAAGLAGQMAALEEETVAGRRESEEIEARRRELGEKAEASRRAAEASEAEAADLRTRLEEGAVRRRELEEQLSTARVEAAKSEERLNHLRAQKIRQEQDREERRRAVEETRLELAKAGRRLLQSELTILAAEQAAAPAYLGKESVAVAVAEHTARQESLRGSRSGLTAAAQKDRSALRTLMEELHTLELAVETSRMERTNLADRIRDDYGVELSELEAAPAGEEEQQQREEVDRLIADLRRKINNIGNVNLEALTELDELEVRFQTLSDQFNDLNSAKKSLESIIAKIDADSRRLFQETLDTVKGHFQILFRKLFGGGQGDIVLEEGVDVLEAGIEIMARPPGKETRNISLLSGGEKTLTCVALLLAVFQYRPSPFCVLDEVDAALDEANIGRFVGVVQEFLAWTQFIIVSHSKKTMTCAGTLYGVTMQESGVSKRVAVRFEDVRDDGEIITRDDVDAEGDKADTDAA
jgi:chromosome segregation protein